MRALARTLKIPVSAVYDETGVVSKETALETLNKSKRICSIN